jgi:YD repeat-containing protein
MPGTWTVYSYAQGYLARADVATVDVGTSNALAIQLTPGETFSISDVQATPLTPNEVAARGVQLSDPQNYQVYDFILYLSTNPDGVTIPNVVLPINPSPNQSISLPPIEIPRLSTTPFPGDSPLVFGSFFFPAPGQRIETWVIIPGRFRILKQFWEATILLKNSAQASNPNAIKITDIQAHLSVPTGMALPDLNGQPQPATRDVAPIAAGSSQRISWIVRGDALGAYLLGADVHGNLQFGSNPTKQPLAISVAPAPVLVYEPTLDVTYIVPSYLVAGQQFTLAMSVINTTPVALYDVSTELDPARMQNAHLAPGQVLSQMIGTLAPAQKTTVQFRLVSDITGCINMRESYVVADPHLQPHLNFLPGHCGGLLGVANCVVGSPNVSPQGNAIASGVDLGQALGGVSSALPSITRTYNSNDASAGYFGVGWRSSLDVRLQLNTDQSVDLINADGRRDRYFLGSDGSYRAPDGLNSTLAKAADHYTLTQPSHASYRFDLNGKLTQILDDANANPITFRYSSSTGDPVGIDDSFGHTLTITSTSNHRIAAISDAGRTVTYSYDTGFNRLQTVQDARGQRTSYSYDGAGLLADQRDPQDHVLLHNRYDGANRLISQTSYSGPGAGQAATVQYDYDSQPGNIVITDPQGNATTVAIDGRTQLPGGSVDALGNRRSYTFDTSGNPIAVTTPSGTVLRAAYNQAGLPTAITSTVTVENVVQTLTSRISYNATNDPLAITDPRGFTRSFHYAAPGKPDRIVDALGNVTSYLYDGRGRVSQMTSPGGLITAYSYDAAGQLASVTRTGLTLILGSTSLAQRSERVDYRYTPQGWLAYQSDPYDVAVGPGKGTSYTYDAAGHTLSITNQLGQAANNRYDAIGNLVESINFLGQKTSYSYDWLRRLTAVTETTSGGDLVTRYSYDLNGNLIARTDPRGVVTSYSYDRLNRLIATSVPLQDGGTDRVSQRYDAAGNLSAVVRFNDKGSSDAITLYTYDELGRPVRTIVAGGVANYQTIRTYDQGGNIIRIRTSKVPSTRLSNWDDPAQATTVTASYDPLGRMTTTTLDAWDPTTATAKALTTSYSYSDTTNAYRVTSPYGMATVIQRDSAGRPVATTIRPSTAAGVQPGALAQTSYRYYDPRSLAVRSLDPIGNQEDAVYDAIGRLTQLTDYTGPGATGTALSSALHYVDAPHPMVISVGPAPNFTRHDMTMDELGQVISATDYSGAAVAYPQTPSNPHTTSYSYDSQGNQVSVSDPSGHVTSFSYENTGWLLQARTTVTPAGQGTQTLTASYTYDSVGNLLRRTDPNGHSTDITYDALNRLVSLTDPLGNSTTRQYDGLGRLVAAQDAKGQQTSYTYDNASRLLQIANAGALSTSFRYTDGGQPLTMTDQVGTATPATTSYAYDGLERLSSVTTPQGLVRYSYDAASRPVGLAFGPDAAHLKQVGYSYDGLDRLSGLTNWLNQSLVYSYSGERLTKIAYPNGVVGKFGYDGAGQLTALTYAANGGSLFGASYSLDVLGRPILAREKQNNTSRTISYAYDELSRLTGETTRTASATTTNTYQYDAAGNRTQLRSSMQPAIQTTPVISTTAYTYDAADQLSNRATTNTLGLNQQTAYSYDPNGNLLSASTSGATPSEQVSVAYAYDARDRLVDWLQQRAQPAATRHATFRYDGTNSRVGMTIDGASTSYLALGAMIFQETAAGQAPTSYLFTPDGSAPIFRTDSAGQSTWYHHDPLGSVRAVSDGAGTIQNSYAYDAFGVTTGQAGMAANARQFAGLQHDPTGLYYAGCGYYDAEVAQVVGGCGASPSSAGAIYPVGPAHHRQPGRGLDAGAASQLGQLLAPARVGPSGGRRGSGSPLADPAACGVFCQYRVTLVKQPDPPPTHVIGAQEDNPRELAKRLGGMIDDLAGKLGRLNDIYHDLTGGDLFKQGDLITGARTLKEVLNSSVGQMALGVAIRAAAFIPAMVSLALDFVPVVGPIKMLLEGIAGQDQVTGQHLEGWQRILNVIPFVGMAAELSEVGAAVSEVTQGAEEAAAVMGEEASAEAEVVGAGLGTETELGVETAQAIEESTIASEEVAVEGFAGEATSSIEGAADETGASQSLSGCNSFSADTPVATDHGEQPISAVHVGDHVLAYDEATGATGNYTVTAVLVHRDPV